MISNTTLRVAYERIDMTHPADGMYYENGQFWEEGKGPKAEIECSLDRMPQSKCAW